MLNKDRKGQIALYAGNEHNEACAVFVAGINSFDLLVLRKLNCGQLHFVEPDAETLLDFDFKAYELARAQSRLSLAKKSIKRLRTDVNEILQKQGKAQEKKNG